MKNRFRQWLRVWIVASHLFQFLMCDETEHLDDANNSTVHPIDEANKKLRSLLAPRMDYEQWKPLGRGDPLKNDPTYDYVPPVLDRVHYWIDPTLRKPDPQLHAENRKTEILILGGVSMKKNSSRSSTSDHKLHEPFLKFVEGPKYNQPKVARPPQLSIPLTYFPSKFYSNKRAPEHSTVKAKQEVPSTVLVPPPMSSKDFSDYHYIPITTTTFTTPSSTQSVSVQEANLIYQTSTLVDWKDPIRSTSLPEQNNRVTWNTPATTTQLMTYPEEVFTEQDNKILEDNEKIKLPAPESYIEIEFPTLDANETRKRPFHFATPPGVTNAYYVPSKGPTEDPIFVRPITQHGLMQTMQTMQPPPMVQSKPPIMTQSKPPIIMTQSKPPTTLQSLLHNEITNTDPFVSSESKLSSVVSTTQPPETMMTMTSLTTDALFKHYKQPTGPLKGPMYLIIQGHSKVKNFSPSKAFHGIPVQEINDVLTSEDDRFSVKHLHSQPEKREKLGAVREGRSGDLQTLSHVVQTGWGAIDFPEIGENRRKDSDVREIELIVKYDVATPSNKTD